MLFAVELGVFIVRPIWRELSEWRRRQGAISATSHGKVLAGLATAAVVLACLPLDRHVSAPAVLGPLGAAPIVAGDPAQVSRVLVANGQRVAAGQGESIAVDEDPVRKTLKPREAMYRARLLAAKGVGPMQPVAVSIAAQGRSLAGRFLGWLAQIVRAEASLSG